MNPEEQLRALWDSQGIPKEKQDQIISAITAAAQPGAQVGPFTIPEEKHDQRKKPAIVGIRRDQT